MTDFTIPKNYIEAFLKIRTKQGKIAPLILKPAQQRLYDEIKKQHGEGKPVRIVILKARQLGFSTIIEALFFQNAATRHNVRTLIVAHDVDSTTNLFRMNKLFYDSLPEQVKPMRKASNSKEILFENPTLDPAEKAKNPGFMSAIKCVPATGSSVGRSDTLTNVHASEVAFWHDMGETFTALLQAVPDERDTAVIVETTPNGFNEFKTFWDDSVAGKTGFLPLFFPWFEEPNYRRPTPPDMILTEEEEKLKATYHLDNEQIAWRRWCIATNLAGDVEAFHQEYPSCPEEAFLTSGNPFFDNTKVINRINSMVVDVRRGRFEHSFGDNSIPEEPSLVEDRKGEVYIYREPEERHPYVIGGDTAGDGSDRFTAYVLDNSTGEQVASIVYDGGSELYYAQQVYCLGRMYNDALIGIEINFSTYPERKLEEWQYPRLYIREKPDDIRGQLSSYKWGWRTDMRTRPLILANLRTWVDQCADTINSVELLREMLTFVRNEAMRAEAAPGAHDDMVMAAAIANYIRPQMPYTVAEMPEPVKVKLIDKLDPKHKKVRKRR